MSWKLGVVGMGPRGLSLLDRLSNLSAEHNISIEVHIFEPGVPGCGVHQLEQPDYLLTNTVCGQITAFGATQSPALRPIGRPSLFEWARSRNYEIIERGSPRRLVQENDYLPRVVLGQYLNWAFRYIMRNLPSHIHSVLHKISVNEVCETSDRQIEILTKTQRLLVDGVVLCTGHSNENSTGPLTTDIGFGHQPYPVENLLRELPDKHRIGVEGMGLSALDVISAATIGRGGRFVRKGAILTYLPSGRELQIVCYSRSGLPLSARASNQKTSQWNYQPIFASIDNIKARRSLYSIDQSPKQKLDFRNDVLPLIQAEMEFIYYTTYFRRTKGAESAEQLAEAYIRSGPKSEEIKTLLSIIPEASHFCWRSLVNAVPEAVTLDATQYRKWLLSQLRRDLEEARLGNLDSPLKAACDVLRDIRPSIRYAIDFAGVTPQSHHFFLNEFVPIMNRLAVGPPLQKLEEFLVLLETGFIDVGTGPVRTVAPLPDRDGFMIKGTAGEREVDELVSARIPLSYSDSRASRIIQSLMSSRIARPYKNEGFSPGGLDVTEKFRIVSRDGRASSPIWALGTPTEGPKFYTYVLSVPAATNSPLNEAESCVKDILESIQNDALRKPSTLGKFNNQLVMPSSPVF